MEQAVTSRPDGTIIRRWWLYESDGHRLVTWAEDEDEALVKMQRCGRFGPDASVATVRIEPAPPMSEAW